MSVRQEGGSGCGWGDGGLWVWCVCVGGGVLWALYDVGGFATIAGFIITGSSVSLK